MEKKIARRTLKRTAGLEERLVKSGVEDSLSSESAKE